MTGQNSYYSILSGAAYNAYDVSKSYMSKNPLQAAALGLGAIGIIAIGPVGTLAIGLVTKGSITAIGNAWEGLKQDTIIEPHGALISLKSQLNGMIKKPDAIAPDTVRELNANLTLLSDNDGAILNELAPQLHPHRFTLKMIREIAENEHLDFEYELLDELKEPSTREDLRKLAQFIDTCITSQTGYLPQLKEKTKNISTQNVLKQPPKELRPLQPLLGKYLNDPNARTLENVKVLHRHLTTLLNNDHQLLIEIAPDLSKEQLQLCDSTFDMIDDFTNNGNLDVNQLNAEETIQCIQAFTQFFNDCMNNRKGLIVQLFDHFHPTTTQVKPANDGKTFVSQLGEVIQEEFTQRNFTKKAVTDFATEKLSATAGGGYNFVKNGIGGLFGKPTLKQPTDAPKVEDVTNEPDASAEGSTVSQFLSYGGSYLKGLLGNGGGVISKLAVSTFAGWLIYGADLFLKEMKKSKVPDQAIAAFEQILISLNEAQESGNFSAVLTQIETARKVLEDNGIITSVHGFSIPWIGAPSEKKEVVETSYSDNIALLKEAIAAPFAPPAQKQNWEDLALGENKKLVYNISNFLALKHIYEEVCGLKPDYETFYLNLIAEATKNGETSTSKLKQILLRKLEEKNVGYLRRVWAGWKFSGFRLLTKKYTAKAVIVYFKEIFKYISENKSDDFNTLRKMMMTNFTGYLTTLGGAYSSIANDPHPSGTKEQMLESELSKKGANRGFEPLELYKELARTVISKMTGEGIFSWITWQFTKLFLDPAQIVKEIVDTSTTMQDVRGYSHALNSVIREELDEIWELLRAEHLNPGTDANPTVSNEVSEGNRKQLSALVKNLFEILGKGKCDTLDELRRLLAEKDMVAKFNQTIDGFYIPDVIDKISTILAVTIESLAKEDQLQKLTYKFSSLLNQSFVVGNVVTQEQMQDEERKIAKRSEQILLYAVNSAINDLYDTSGKKQQAETNRFITNLQKQSDKYINGTQNLSGAKQDLIDLTNMPDPEIESLEAKNKINKITEDALAYANYCHETDLTVQSSQLSSGNKEEIAKRCLGVAEKSKPFVEAIAKLKTHSNSLEDIRIGKPHLQQIETILADLGIKLFHKSTLTTEDITYAEAQVMLLEGHILAVKKMQDSKKSIDQISTDSRRIASISQKLDNAGQNETLLSELQADLLKYWNAIKKNNTEITVANLKRQEFVDEQKRILQQHIKGLNELFDLSMGLSQIVSQMESVATILVDLTRANAAKLLQEELIKPNSIFDQIVYDKKQHIGKFLNNAELEAKVTSLKQKLLGSLPSTFRELILEQLKNIHDATIEDQVTAAQSKFLELLRQSVDKAANLSMADERVKYARSYKIIQEGTVRTHLLEPEIMDRAKRGIYEATIEASKHLETFATWEKETIKPVSYINFNPLNLKGPQDFTSGRIYGRVKEHMNGFLSFLKRDDTYRYGILHHLFLIPYIQAMKGPKV